MTLKYRGEGIAQEENRGPWPAPLPPATAPTDGWRSAPAEGWRSSARAIADRTGPEKVPLPNGPGRRRRSVAPLGIDVSESHTGEDLRGLAETRLRVRRGRRLFRAGDPFDFLYFVRSGFFKSTVVSRDGREQVTGFNMVGDLIGFDGIGTSQHTCELTALEDSEVFAIPYAWLIDDAGLDSTRRRLVQRAMSGEIVRENNVLIMLGSMCAEERIAGFLLGMAERLRARGFSPTEFVLRMTRSEIGSFLGLKLETVSRQLSQMAQHGLLEVNLKHIRVIDAEGLRALVRRNMHAARGAPRSTAGESERSNREQPPAVEPLAVAPLAFV